MKLIITRHTETNYNILKLCNSDPSVPVHLTDKGKQQAQELASKLANYNIDKIYISELPRTRETAEYINHYHNLNLIVDPRINENNTGYEGKSLIEWQRKILAHNDWWRAKINDGESLEQAYNRAKLFIEGLKNSNSKCPIVVTHGFIVQCIYKILLDKEITLNTDYLIQQGNFAELEL